MTELSEGARRRLLAKVGDRVARRVEKTLRRKGGLLLGPQLVVKTQGAYRTEKQARLGHVTGIDDKAFAKLLAGDRASTVMFVDSTLCRAYWATVAELRGPVVLQFGKRGREEFPISDLKGGFTPQQLWPVVWFERVLKRWEPILASEARAILDLRDARTGDGFVRIAEADAERAVYESFSTDFAQGMLQGALFESVDSVA